MKAHQDWARVHAREAVTADVAESVRQNALSQQIAGLNNLTAPQIRDQWRRLYRDQPPRLSRDLLIRAIAYRMQELAYGGLSKATQRKLANLAKELKANGSVAAAPEAHLRPGSRLLQEWRGRTHTVVVTEDGFEYAGTIYLSLTKVAHVITGAHWSGPGSSPSTRSKNKSRNRILSRTTQPRGTSMADQPSRGSDRKKLRCAIYIRKSSEAGWSRTSTPSMPSARPARPSSPARTKGKGPNEFLFDECQEATPKPIDLPWLLDRALWETELGKEIWSCRRSGSARSRSWCCFARSRC